MLHESPDFDRFDMTCHCGSHDFSALGIQPGFLNPARMTAEHGNPDSNVIYLANCTHCRTTLSCSEETYRRLKSHR